MASAKSGASTSTGSKSSKFKVPLLTDPGGDRDSPVIDRTSSDDGGAQATNPGPRLNAQQFQFPAAKRAFKRPFTPPLVSAPRSSAGNAEEESSGKETEDARGQRADQKRIGAASKGPLTVPGKPPPFKRRALVSARRTVIAPATEEEGGVGGESRGNAEDVRARTRTQGGSHDADIPRAPSRTHPHPISGSSVASEREGGSTAAAEKGPPAAAKIPISIGNSENKSDAQMVTVAGAGRTTSDSVMIHASPPPPPPPPPPFHAVVDGGGATGRGSSKGAPAAAGQTTACATDSSAHAGVKHVDDEGISGDVGGSGCTMAMAASAGKRLSSFIAPRRKGLLHVLSSGRASGSGSETTAGNGRPPVNHGVPEAEEANYFSVMYCQPKRNSKRKGPWSDGVFVVRSRTTLLQDMEGKELAKGDARGCKNLQEGATARAGTYEVEVMGKVDKKDYESGSIFVGDASDAPLGSSAAVLKPMKKLQSQTLEVLPQRKRCDGWSLQWTLYKAKCLQCQTSSDFICGSLDKVLTHR
ncbi:hypothetical protein CBR_g40175 [Chara braunii]|uniref:DUF2439 domain-containing protein n=1 Tax=Chara braunii TaxID=69332 RepID=A0A388LTA0_CHABU|nr:hypothetical protein CBR_g40175 [Chara braunii]|eukprot:GBG85537.1 hypothetical protein CBR_g40175 [Chara braunii]